METLDLYASSSMNARRTLLYYRSGIYITKFHRYEESTPPHHCRSFSHYKLDTIEPGYQKRIIKATGNAG